MSSLAIAKFLELSPKTIETYREHIKKKLLLENGASLVAFATLWHAMDVICRNGSE